MKLLICEDEKAMSEALCDILNCHDYQTDSAFTGTQALSMIREGGFDGIILDVMMPELDGFSLLRQIRQEGCEIPVLILSARGGVSDKVLGFELGADDYLPKPFAMAELLVRIRAMVRHQGHYVPDCLMLGNLSLRRGSSSLFCNGSEVPLSNLEYRLMELFLSNPGMYFSADTLLDRVWNCNAEINTVWVYISYLRKKLSSIKANVTIRSKRNIGYALEEERK